MPIAILVSGQRQVPSEVPALGLRALPELRAGLGRTRHQDAPHAPVDQCVGRRDDQVREPIARDVGHRHYPMAEEPVRRLTVPGADQRAARPRPHRGAPALERPLELEARAGGDVRVAVAVDVERLAEAETQLTLWDAPGEAPRDAPARSGSSAGHRGPGGARERKAGNRVAEERGDARESASPARACRRRRVLH